MKSRFVPALSKPCSKDWNSMTGDDKCRFCSQCQLPVHNLSAMSAEESATLLAGRSTRHCLAFEVTGRSIQVHTSTWVLLQKLLLPWRAGMALLALAGLPASLTGCALKPPPDAEPSVSHSTGHKKTAASVPQEPDLGAKEPIRMMGAPVYQAPRWRRILFFWEK
jgi:hypothetical protein